MMKKTIFDTPLLSPFLKFCTGPVLTLFGWKLEGTLPEKKKFVMIAAPHTSNWDMPVMMMIAFAFELKIYWMGKDALFKFPFCTIMKWFGGVPIDRTQSNDVVAQSIEIFNNSEEFVLTVPPEGTRDKVRYWKSGFYHIANGAGVPIVIGFIDWGRKVGGVGEAFKPTGDAKADMNEIQAFYKSMQGKIDSKLSSINKIAKVETD